MGLVNKFIMDFEELVIIYLDFLDNFIPAKIECLNLLKQMQINH